MDISGKDFGDASILKPRNEVNSRDGSICAKVAPHSHCALRAVLADSGTTLCLLASLTLNETAHTRALPFHMVSSRTPEGLSAPGTYTAL